MDALDQKARRLEFSAKNDRGRNNNNEKNGLDTTDPLIAQQRGHRIEPFVPDFSEEKESDLEERCGIFCFKPNFLQRFRNMKTFLLVFIIIGMAQGMYYSYWNMAISSMEKRFQIPSKVTGIITAMNDISHLTVVLLVAHFCGKGHRPRWLAVGSLIVGIAVTAYSLPEFVVPKWDATGIAHTVTNSSTAESGKEMCDSTRMYSNNDTEDTCGSQSQLLRSDVMWPMIIMTLGQLLMGVGTTFPVTLALSFMDDNVKIKDAPIYFSLAIAGRFLGPTFGVFLGSFCLSTYVDLTVQNLEQTDPRWMGAWWLGFLIIGLCTCATSFLYLCFPKTIKHQTSDRFEKVSKPSTRKINMDESRSSERKTSKLASLPRDIKRLLTNKIYMSALTNGCIDMLVISGYYNYAAKYMEFHFRRSPSEAGKASGLTSIFAMSVGGIVGGLLVQKLKLQPKQVAIWILVSSLLTSFCYFILMGITCESRVLHSTWDSDGMINVETNCSQACHCVGHSFSPVCDESEGVNYYSPCHAGCTKSFTENDTKYYTNCACLASVSSDQSSTTSMTLDQPTSITVGFMNDSMSDTVSEFRRIVKRGYCDGGCGSFWVYVAVSATFQFIGMLPFSGAQMLSFRIVEPDLKGLSKGLATMTASIFAFIPGPIIFGVLIDSTCKLWNKLECNQKGACLVYDLDGFRIKMHLYVAIIKTIACILDVYVLYKVRDMKFERQSIEAEEEAIAEQVLAGKTGSIRDLSVHT